MNNKQKLETKNKNNWTNTEKNKHMKNWKKTKTHENHEQIWKTGKAWKRNMKKWKYGKAWNPLKIVEINKKQNKTVYEKSLPRPWPRPWEHTHAKNIVRYCLKHLWSLPIMTMTMTMTMPIAPLSPTPWSFSSWLSRQRGTLYSACGTDVLELFVSFASGGIRACCSGGTTSRWVCRLPACYAQKNIQNILGICLKTCFFVTMTVTMTTTMTISIIITMADAVSICRNMLHIV